MCEVEISFNPAELKNDDECYPAFRAGGLALKFWALYKRNHITSQHFRSSLGRLIDHFKLMNDDGSDIQPYKDIDEFRIILRQAGIGVSSEWLVRHWDYFNLNIQKKVTLKYKAMVEIDQFMPIT